MSQLSGYISYEHELSEFINSDIKFYDVFDFEVIHGMIIPCVFVPDDNPKALEYLRPMIIPPRVTIRYNSLYRILLLVSVKGCVCIRISSTTSIHKDIINYLQSFGQIYKYHGDDIEAFTNLHIELPFDSVYPLDIKPIFNDYYTRIMRHNPYNLYLSGSHNSIIAVFLSELLSVYLMHMVSLKLPPFGSYSHILYYSGNEFDSQKNIPANKFSCIACKCDLDDFQQYLKHIFEHHSSKIIYSNLISGPKLCCDICNSAQRSEVELLNHTIDQHPVALGILLTEMFPSNNRISIQIARFLKIKIKPEISFPLKPFPKIIVQEPSDSKPSPTKPKISINARKLMTKKTEDSISSSFWDELEMIEKEAKSISTNFDHFSFYCNICGRKRKSPVPLLQHYWENHRKQ